MAEKKDQANTGLNQLEIEQLEELLRVSLDAQEDSDADKILDLLQIIEDRKNQSQGVPDFDIDKAWETFLSLYASEDVLYPTETVNCTMETPPEKEKTTVTQSIDRGYGRCMFAGACNSYGYGNEILSKDVWYMDGRRISV